jgi:platelet-activating factor acetylhydrolase
MINLPPPTGPLKPSYIDIENDDLLVRIFYPSTDTTLGSTPFFPSSFFYSKGLANFLKRPLFEYIMAPLFSLARVPVSKESPVAEVKEPYPIIVFSHGISRYLIQGLAGMRTMYTSYCSNMASHGFICAAIEHRDKSAARSMRNNYEEDIAYEPPAHFDADFARIYRRDQLENIRLKEVASCVCLLRSLNSGNEIVNRFSSKFNLGMFKGALDLDRLIMAGHRYFNIPLTLASVPQQH